MEVLNMTLPWPELLLLMLLTLLVSLLLFLQSVEWDMLLFFAAQFVMVECAAEIGMIDMIGGWLESIIRSAPAQQRTLVAVQILLWASAAISGILVSDWL
jgi:Na+/H+ antiporter NhaD/arsenite permease-like protein